MQHYGICDMQHCDMQHRDNMQHATEKKQTGDLEHCDRQHAADGMRHATRNGQHATDDMQLATCNRTWNCNVHTCNRRHATCNMQQDMEPQHAYMQQTTCRRHQAAHSMLQTARACNGPWDQAACGIAACGIAACCIAAPVQPIHAADAGVRIDDQPLQTVRLGHPRRRHLRVTSASPHPFPFRSLQHLLRAISPLYTRACTHLCARSRAALLASSDPTAARRCLCICVYMQL
jgi:hypothetical protein